MRDGSGFLLPREEPGLSPEPVEARQGSGWGEERV